MFVPLLVFVSTSGACVPTTVVIKICWIKLTVMPKGWIGKMYQHLCICNVNHGLEILDLFAHWVWTHTSIFFSSRNILLYLYLRNTFCTYYMCIWEYLSLHILHNVPCYTYGNIIRIFHIYDVLPLHPFNPWTTDSVTFLCRINSVLEFYSFPSSLVPAPKSPGI